MNAFHRMQIAIYNFFNAKRSYYYSMVFYLSFISAVLLISAVVFQTITNYYNQTINGDMYYCRLTYDIQSNVNPDDDTVFQSLQQIPLLSVPSVSTIIRTPLIDGNSAGDFINLNRVTLETPDKTYTGTDDRTFTFRGNSKKHAMLSLNCFQPGYTPFSNMEKQVFSFYNPGRDLIAAGSEITCENEMMLSDYIVSHFGISDYSQILGKQITLCVDNIPLLSGYTLTGIVDSEFYNILPDNDLFFDTDFYCAQVLLCCSRETVTAFGGKKLRAVFFPEHYSDLPEVIHSIEEQPFREQLDYDNTAGVQYLFAANAKKLSLLILIMLAAFIITAMMLQMISVSSHSLKIQATYAAMLRAVGLTKKSLFKIVMTEHLFSFLYAYVTANILAILFMFLSNLLFTKIFGEGVTVSAQQFIRISLKVAGPIVVVFAALISAVFFKEQRKPIQDLLRQ